MTVPTIFFPEQLRYYVGLADPRAWSTLVTPGPTGRRQARQMQLRPKRQLKATVYPFDQEATLLDYDSDVPIGDQVFGQDLRFFLDEIKGRFNPFCIFNPHRSLYRNVDLGLITLPGDLPYSLPMRDAWPSIGVVSISALTITPVTPPGSSPVDIVTFTTDNLGTHGETRLVTATLFGDADPDPATYRLRGTLDGHERISAVMLSDIDAIQYNWNHAVPPSELSFALEEWFG